MNIVRSLWYYWYGYYWKRSKKKNEKEISVVKPIQAAANAKYHPQIWLELFC